MVGPLLNTVICHRGLTYHDPVRTLPNVSNVFFVDNAHANALLQQGKGQEETGRAGSDLFYARSLVLEDEMFKCNVQ